MAFTYFFRDVQTLETIRDYVIPKIRTRSSFRIWDAGCAMGPEPYTLSIILRENMGPMIFRNIKIDATDIDTSDQFEAIIKNGIYPYDQLSRIPKEIFKKYFSPTTNKDEFIISEEIRNRIEFTRHNLLHLQPLKTGYGLVLCKNVLLHFKQEERIKVIQMFHDVLEPGGFFVTEQTQKMPKELDGKFEQVVSNAQIFKKIG